eukprot:843442-Pelagomonas_calceolata.AAC.1
MHRLVWCPDACKTGLQAYRKKPSIKAHDCYDARMPAKVGGISCQLKTRLLMRVIGCDRLIYVVGWTKQ